jgi:hypothetical protein
MASWSQETKEDIAMAREMFGTAALASRPFMGFLDVINRQPSREPTSKNWGYLRPVFKKMLGNNRLIAQADQILMFEESGLEIETTSIILEFDCSLTFKQMLKACNFDWANPDITPENFPFLQCSGRKKMPLEIVSLSKNTVFESIFSKFSQKNLVFGTLFELLAVGMFLPYMQQKFQLYALGSYWERNDGQILVPYLLAHGASRGIELACRDYGWFKHSRILGIPASQNK